MQPTASLIDRFNRTIRYVRLSVTDRCDFRCVYCMDETMQFTPRNALLSLEEIGQVARAFCDLGVDRIRITGGEPLVRRNILSLFTQLQALKHAGQLTDLSLTTNGSQLARYAAPLREAGVDRLNISLDSLQPERFKAITRTGDLAQVLEGIEAARAVGFKRIKMNAVIMHDRNADEILDLTQFAIDREFDIAFIEEMPLGSVVGSRLERFCASDEVVQVLQQRYQLLPSTHQTGGPARYYQIQGTASRVGLISPHSHNFCDACNRVRVTTEGRLLLCLGQEHSVDLRAILRAHPNDLAPLKAAIVDSMAIKPKGHDFDLNAQPVIFRHMNVTGG